MYRMTEPQPTYIVRCVLQPKAPQYEEAHPATQCENTTEGFLTVSDIVEKTCNELHNEGYKIVTVVPSGNLFREVENQTTQNRQGFLILGVLRELRPQTPELYAPIYSPVLY